MSSPAPNKKWQWYQLPPGQETTGGDWVNFMASEVWQGLQKTWSGFGAVGLAVILIFADLGLGPLFLIAQAKQEGVELSPLAWATPWLFSIATTGLLYAMWESIQDSYGSKWLKVFVILLGAADSLTDMGGANWVLNDNPAAGAVFWPLEGTPDYKVFLMNFIGIMCFFHEPVLRWLLGRKQQKVDKRLKDQSLPELLETAMVYMAGFTLNVTTAIGKVGAVLMLPALDVILTPQLEPNNSFPTTMVGLSLWAFSFALTALTGAMWGKCLVGGGFKKTWEASKKNKLMLGGLWAAILIDTYFDARGYNMALYGQDRVVIDDPTPSWLVTIVMVLALCMFGELLNKTLGDILGEKARAYRGKGKGPGGTAAVGGMSTGAAPGGMSPMRPGMSPGVTGMPPMAGPAAMPMRPPISPAGGGAPAGPPPMPSGVPPIGPPPPPPGS